ncbi:MAG: hypothetical protein IJB90_02590 [Clostridia bacterium]|nr:hypothetical protein [Clostridia bacterium]
MNKKWEYYEVNEERVNEISEKFNISKLLAKILVNRDIVEDEKIKVFLEPTRNDFYDPFLMPDMEKAVDRIIKAIENKEKVMIYGDYDVDGITSITVLKKFLEERGLDCRILYSKPFGRRIWIKQRSNRANYKSKIYINDNSGLWDFWNRRNRIM